MGNRRLIMKKVNLILILLLIFNVVIVYGQEKVANYSYGAINTKEYEEFSFWVKNKKRAEIVYNYGKDLKTVNLTYIGKGTLNNIDCFLVQFANGYVLYISPFGYSLKVTDLNGKYNKFFAWKYEGPVDMKGTFCTPCAVDENEAIKLINKYFMK